MSMKIKVYERKQANEAYTGIDNFIEGLTDECNAYRKDDNSEAIPEEVLEQLPEGWKEHDADHGTTMVAMSIKYRGYKSYLDKVDGVSSEQVSQIVWDENQLFLETLCREIEDSQGITPYVFGRMGGWIGFKWSDFAAKYVTYVLKDDEATRKDIFDTVWDKYVDEDDTSFTGKETLEELISKLDINNASEGAYVFDDQDWFTAVVSDEGIELMENLSTSIDDQEAYMLTQEWYDGIKDVYDLETSEEE